MEKASVAKPDLSTEQIGFQDEEVADCYGHVKVDEASGYVVSTPSRSDEDEDLTPSERYKKSYNKIMGDYHEVKVKS